MKRWWILLLILILPSFWWLLRPGFHNIQDSMQVFRAYQMKKCFEDTQIPCRWVPDLGYGFGYPLYIYYGPAPYYLAAVANLVGIQLLDGIKILMILGFILGALGIFAVVWEKTKNRWAAMLGAVLFTYGPVRAVEIYVRGAMSEFLAATIAIWIYYFSLKFEEGKAYKLGLSLSVALLLTTHNLMSLAFIPVLAVLTIIETRDLKKLANRLLWWTVGGGMAAFYLIPLVAEKNYVHLETMFGGYFDYRQHFVSLKQLFIERVWGYGSSGIDGSQLSLSLGQVHWMGALAAGVLALWGLRKKEQVGKSRLILVLLIMAGVFTFLMHGRSSLIWEELGLGIFQFPWRFLVVTNWLLALAGGIGFSLIEKNKVIGVGLIVLTLAVNISYFRPQIWRPVSDRDMVGGTEFVKQQTASIFDYLPKSAQLPPNYPAPEEPEVFDGEAEIVEYFEGTDWQYLKIRVLSPKVTIRFPMFDFSGMTVRLNGKVVDHNHDNCRLQDYCFGQVNTSVPQGEHRIVVKLENTAPRKVGDIISGASLVMVLLLLL